MQRETAVDACARAIRRAILLGEHEPGARLPPERALAERLGVNRTTLRAALGRLASARLLTVRQGSGYVVQDYRRVAGLELLPELLGLLEGRQRAEGIADLLEVRRRLALLVLERLAARVDGAAADRVARAVDRFERVVVAGGSPDALAEVDLEVTGALLAATGSPVLGLCLNPVSLVVQGLEVLREQMYAAPETNVLAYRLLVAWLRAPSPEGVALLAEELARRDARTVEGLRMAVGNG